MNIDHEQLFLQMARMRCFEEAIADLWRRGLISGEMHLGTGEEAIVEGVAAHLREKDAMSLDHRSTPPLVARGADLRAIVLELLGHDAGLCHGQGGHMHLFDPSLLAASSGIVGSSAPLACGFAIAAQNLHPGSVAVAFFGEGAMNQGMVMEALNLAAVWRLPVIFVCKDNRFSSTTHSPSVTAGSILGRARSFRIPSYQVDGTDVEAVWRAAGEAVERARRGHGPSFIVGRCWHLEGHFLGDPLLRMVRYSGDETGAIAPGLIQSLRQHGGAPTISRIRGLVGVGATMVRFGMEHGKFRRDPLLRARKRLSDTVASELKRQARSEIEQAVREAQEIAETTSNG